MAEVPFHESARAKINEALDEAGHHDPSRIGVVGACLRDTETFAHIKEKADKFIRVAKSSQEEVSRREQQRDLANAGLIEKGKARSAKVYLSNLAYQVRVAETIKQIAEAEAAKQT